VRKRRGSRRRIERRWNIKRKRKEEKENNKGTKEIK
jgi:hypothetical protein